jgi:hypothetical protein
LKQTYLSGNVFEPGWISGIELGYELDDRGFESRKGLENFLNTVSRPA